MSKDSCGREITYLRISVTDRCNLRCVYCMPPGGVIQTSHNEILTYDEIARIVRIAASQGVSRIKITGGEPLARKGVAHLVKMLKGIPGIEQVTLTTNGILLPQQIEELVKNGLDAVNISLDTPDEKEYRRITRRGDLAQVEEGIRAASSFPDLTVKINSVLLREIEGRQYVKLAEYAKNQGIPVRYIERMPVGMEASYPGRSQDEIMGMLEQVYGKAKKTDRMIGNGPAVYYRFEDFRAEIGFISPLSYKFCENCNRIRLTSEGYLKTCLQYNTGVDLKRLLREGAGDEELRSSFLRAIKEKPLCHRFTKEDAGEKGEIDAKGMYRIGG